jgi:hypothetical protein
VKTWGEVWPKEPENKEYLGRRWGIGTPYVKSEEKTGLEFRENGNFSILLLYWEFLFLMRSL